jgi:hypothetical protein
MVAAVVAEMQQRLENLPPEKAHRATFLGTYLRTTEAVGAAVDAGSFEAPEWVERWDVVFAKLYLDAHVNYDLPQAMLAVISPDDFNDPILIGRRRRDHERIDTVLAGRVKAEDEQGRSEQTRLDRLLGPLNRLSSKRFLKEARQKVWHNVEQLHAARLESDDTYRARLAELEVLSAARIADLLAPGQVLLRLAVAGFGVVLPPP